MLQYENPQYFKNIFGNISVITVYINGVKTDIPLDPANADYQNIMKLVEEGKLTIAEPEANAQETTK